MNSCPRCRGTTGESSSKNVMMPLEAYNLLWKKNYYNIIFLQAHVPLATEELKYITTQSKNMIMNHLFLATTAFKTISSIAGLTSKKALLQYGGTELKIGSLETTDPKAMTEVMLTLNAMYSVFIPLRTGIGNGWLKKGIGEVQERLWDWEHIFVSQHQVIHVAIWAKIL